MNDQSDFDNKPYECIYTAQGKLEAESIKAFLESFEIPSEIYQESAGTVYGLTVGLLGAADVMVPSQLAEQARVLLEKLDRGDFETVEHDL